MKKQKHKWIKKVEYVCLNGDENYHHIVEYEECKYCGGRK